MSDYTPLSDLNIKIQADGADKESILKLKSNPLIQGFTTNPSLMRKAGVSDYVGFAKELIQEVPDRPISFEVFASEFDEMERQAKMIAEWGENVYVKIPVINPQGDSSCGLIERLAKAGIHLNVTAIYTIEQVEKVAGALAEGPGSFISIFAGRIADTGRDPEPLMEKSVQVAGEVAPKAEILWASCRELLSIYQAERTGCQIITVPHAILGNLHLVGKDLNEYSLDTVKTFDQDAKAAGYSLS